MIRSIFFLTALLFCIACEPLRTAQEQWEYDIQRIKNYLEEQGLTATETASGLHYLITAEGSGGSPGINANVTVRYKGYLLNGKVFDETTGTETVTFPLKNLIPGWQEGIPYLKKGGSGKFLLPSALGYGPSGSGSIKPNQVLIFDIELVNF